MLLRVVFRSLKLVKLLSQQLATFLLFRDRRSVGQQCFIRLYSWSHARALHTVSMEIAMHLHVENKMAAKFCKFTKSYGSYPSHHTLRVRLHWALQRI